MNLKRKFVISAIHYDPDRTFIEKVKAHEVRPEGELSSGNVIDRSLLVGLLLGGNPVWTLDNDPANPMKLGKGVHRVYDEEHLFLSTDPMERRGDNLGKLPEF